MKTINIYFEDDEMEQLQDVKGDLTWREFVLQLVQPKNNKVK
jgi:hypothetical protein